MLNGRGGFRRDIGRIDCSEEIELDGRGSARSTPPGGLRRHPPLGGGLVSLGERKEVHHWRIAGRFALRSGRTMHVPVARSARDGDIPSTPFLRGEGHPYATVVAGVEAGGLGVEGELGRGGELRRERGEVLGGADEHVGVRGRGGGGEGSLRLRRMLNAEC